MRKDEFLNSLTAAQRAELDNDIRTIRDEVIRTGNLHADKMHTLKSNIRLKDEIFLNVTFEFFIGHTGNIQTTIIEVEKFNSVDEYLDSINSDNGLGEEWKDLK
jgi:hypothetical protein